MPVLLWYNEVALYMEGKQPKEKLTETITTSACKLLQNKYKAGRINELLETIAETIPLEVALIRNRITQFQDKNI